jgi:hypothetical protein
MARLGQPARWFFVAAMAGGLLAACAGGVSSVPQRGPDVIAPPFAAPDVSTIAVKPRRLALLVGASGSVVVTERRYAGSFKTTSTGATACKGVATWEPATGKGPSLTVKVRGVAHGSCAIRFSDAQKHAALLRVLVRKTSPSPSPALLFVADADNNAVKEIPRGCVTAACVTTLGGGFSAPESVAVDYTGDVLVIANYDVEEIPSGCIVAACVITLGGGFSLPIGVAFDGWDGSSVVVTDNSSAVKVIPPGCVNATCVTTLGGGFVGPTGVAVDGSGNVFVADWGNHAVKQIPPGCIVAACVVTLGGPFEYPFGIAVDGSDNVFVGGFAVSAVKEIPHGCFNAACVTTLVGGFSSPVGVAVDTSGNVFVSDTGLDAVKEIPSNCVVAACVTTLGGGFSNPLDVAVPFVRPP